MRKAIIYKGKEVKNFDDIIGMAKYHHNALHRGYVSRKLECVIEDYIGKFGTGYKVIYPNYSSTCYVRVSYFINEAE